MLMSVKTVTLSEDAYLVLASRKREGESFSEVVRRLVRSEHSLREFVGGWSDAPTAKYARFEAWVEQSDRRSRSEMRRLGPPR